MNTGKLSAGRKSQVTNKIILIVAVIAALVFSTASPVAASAAKTAPAVKKTVIKKAVAKQVVKKKAATSKTSSAKTTKTTLKWTADGLKALGSMASFDYSYTIRNAFIKKVENYAKRKNIKVITAETVKSMDE